MASTDPAPTIIYPCDPPFNVPSREYIGRGEGSTQELSFGGGISRAVFYMDIPFNQLLDAISALVGYSTRGGAGSGIQRILPFRHPQFDFLWCKNVSGCRYVQYQGQNTEGVASGYPYGYYSTARLTLDFWQPPYAIVADGIVSEWERFTTTMVHPSCELLNRQTGFYKYTDPLAPSYNNSNGKVPGNRSSQLHKKRLVVKWWGIPWNSLFPMAADNGLNYTSPNIDSLVNRVNGLAFAGCHQQTLLCEAPEFEYVTWPVSPQVLGTPVLKSSLLWNVTFNLLYFDPPINPAGSGLQGHNLAPDYDGYWYAYGPVGNTSNIPYPNFVGNTPIGSGGVFTDFSNLFKSN